MNSTNNLGTVRINFSSDYSNISNGLTLGCPIITQTADIASSITQFIGTITATTLTVNSFGYGQMLQIVGGTTGSSTTLTLTGTLTAIPVGSVITGQGIVGYTVITAQTSASTYTMSVAQTISGNTLITAALPNNICLPVGALITGTGVTAGTVITAQTGAYTYTINNTNVISTIPMISNPTNYFLYLDTQSSFGLTISTPSSNYLNVQFLKPDENTLMTNVPEYTLILNFDFDDKEYDSD